MLVVCITLPEASARKLAEDTDPTTAGDPGYVMKSVVAEIMGDTVVRPFRGLTRDGVLKIVGFAHVADAVRPTASAAKLSATVEFLPWEVEAGSEILLDVLACPVQSVTQPKSAPAPGTTVRKTMDVADVGIHASRPAAYNAWVQKRIGDPDNGCTPMSIFRFTDTGKVRILRKARGHNRRIQSFDVPSFSGSMKVRVDDPVAFSRFLTTGIGKNRGFGYGAAIPKEVLDELAS